MKEISITKLKTITESGIEFTDGSRIIFSDCAKNSTLGTKCVALRDITADPPYIEFFTADIPTRIIFDKRGIFAKNSRKFTKLHLQIQDFGYTTYDLS